MPGYDPAPPLRAATQRLVRTVDRLEDRSWREPSLLPGWTRAHVVAHLALNADGLAGAVEAALVGEQLPMYESDAARDADIDHLAAARPDELRERLLGSTTRMSDALVLLAQALPERPEVLRLEVERHPGARRFTLGDVAGMRLREVEVHHADLGLDYSSGDWDPAFSAFLVDAMATRPEPLVDCVVAPDDHDQRWTLGAGGPVVSGPLHALAWWTTGRPAGPGLTSDSGELPQTRTW